MVNTQTAKVKQNSVKISDIIFLGLCERANYVRDGISDIFKWNIIGLRSVLLSCIFPFNLKGLILGFSSHPNTAKIKKEIRLVSDSGEIIGQIDLHGDEAKPIRLHSDDLSAEGQNEILSRDEPILLIQEYSWVTFFLPLRELDWIIQKPGTYYIEYKSSGKFIRIGEIGFGAYDIPPLSPDRIAAIKSEPNAAKEVKYRIGCGHCSSKYQAYAALARNPAHEKDGWIWYRESPDTFICDCGKLVLDLQYIKRNLHGLLGGIYGDANHLNFMPLYEKTSLESIRAEFGRIINKNVREELLQKFIADNPIILHQFPALRIIPKPKILTSYVADFGIVTPQKEFILIEIEKTTTKLMNKDGGMAQTLNHAFDQVNSWLHEVDEHRIAVLDKLDIDRSEVSRVSGVVIAGRDVGYDARNLRQLKGRDWGKVKFLTYDDLLFSLDTLIRRVEKI